MSDGEIELRLAELGMDAEATWTMPGEHWSLGGSQQQFALRRIGDEYFEAHGAQPISHIVKPGVHGLKAQALIEHVSMRAARACGVDMAQTDFVSFKSENAIIVTRFDRASNADGSLTRLHQEDLCQAGLAYDTRGGGSRELSMSIAGMFHAEQVTTDHWKRFAEQNRLDEAGLLYRVQEIAHLMPDALQDAIAEIDDWDGTAAELRVRLLPAAQAQASTIAGRR